MLYGVVLVTNYKLKETHRVYIYIQFCLKNDLYISFFFFNVLTYKTPWGSLEAVPHPRESPSELRKAPYKQGFKGS